MSQAQKMFTTVVVGLLVVSLGATVVFYRKYSVLKNDPQRVAQENVVKLLADVSGLMELPKSETPTIATVVDPEKVKNQPFFDGAAADDRVLIYTNARQAILYRPSTHKIIRVAPLVVGPAGNQVAPNP